MTRLSVGVDVSEKTLDVAYWDQYKNKAIIVGKFPNNQKGFQAIERKIRKRGGNIGADMIHLVAMSNPWLISLTAWDGG